MFSSPVRKIVAGGLVALSSASFAEVSRAQRPSRPETPQIDGSNPQDTDDRPHPLPIPIPEPDNPDATLPTGSELPAADADPSAMLVSKVSRKLNAINAAISKSPCDISTDLKALDKLIRNNANHAQCEETIILREIEGDLDDIAASCASHLTSSDPQVLAAMANNFNALTSGFKNDDSHYPKGRDGLNNSGQIEAMLADITENDGLNRARLDTAVEIASAYHGNITEPAILAVTTFIPKIETAAATSTNTRESLIDTIKETLIAFDGVRLNSSPETLQPNAELITTYHKLLAANPTDEDAYIKAVHALHLIIEAEPALRYCTRFRDNEEFHQLFASIEEIYRFGLSGSEQISSDRKREFLKVAAFDSLQDVGTFAPARQDSFIDLIASRYLQTEQTSIESVEQCTHCMQARVFGGEIRERSNWDAYALFRILNENREFFKGALDQLQQDALEAQDSDMQLAALTRLHHVESFFKDVQHFDHPYTPFKNDSDYETAVATHRAAAMEWLNESRAFPTAQIFLNERELAHVAPGRDPYSDKIDFRVSDQIEQIVAAELRDSPKRSTEVLALIATALEKESHEINRTALYRQLRSPAGVSQDQSDAHSAFVAIAQDQLVQELSPTELGQLGQSIGSWCFREDPEQKEKSSSGWSRASRAQSPPLTVETMCILDSLQRHAGGEQRREGDLPPLESLYLDMLALMEGDLQTSLTFLHDGDNQLPVRPDPEMVAQIATMRHNAALILSGSGLTLQAPESINTLTTLCRDSLSSAGDAEDLGERVAGLFTLLSLRDDTPYAEIQHALTQEPQELRKLLFDGRTGSKEDTSYQQPVFDTLAMQVALMADPHDQQLRERLIYDSKTELDSIEMQRTKVVLQLEFAESFLESTRSIDFETRVTFLQDLGFSGSDATDPDAVLKLLKSSR